MAFSLCRRKGWLLGKPARQPSGFLQVENLTGMSCRGLVSGLIADEGVHTFALGFIVQVALDGVHLA
jgi:hypothetical protein